MTLSRSRKLCRHITMRFLAGCSTIGLARGYGLTCSAVEEIIRRYTRRR